MNGNHVEMRASDRGKGRELREWQRGRVRELREWQRGCESVEGYVGRE